LQPDLILGWRFPHRIYQRWLEGIAPTHLMSGAGYEAAIARLRTVAQLTDRVEAGEEAIAQLEQSITHLKQTYQRYPRKTVLIMGGSRPSRLVNRYPVEAETGTLGSVLKQFTHFPWKKPDPNKGEAGLMYLPLKKIVAVNPDVIFVQSYGGQSLSSQLVNDSTWQQLRAVRQQHVYEIGRVWHWGNGTRLIKVMLERLLPLIYPDAS
ncbi:MAG: ABC transporter substrate-binding protein, partial [Cyanobacteria bacterium J06627_28]